MSSVKDKIKARLAKMKEKGGGGESVDYDKIYFKPKLGDQVIRIVPNKFATEEDLPETEVTYHEQKVFKRSVYSLENFGEKDPVRMMIKELFSDEDPSTKEASEALAKKLFPKKKYAFQVIVRGEEEKGVRIWETNKTNTEAIYALMDNEDYGDITDVVEGTDLTLKGFEDTFQQGKRSVKFTNIEIQPKRNASKLSKDPDLVEKWLEEQQNPLAVHKKLSFDEIKSLLMKYMDPESEDVVDEEETSKKKSTKDSSDDEEDAPVSKKYGSKATSKKKEEAEDLVEDPLEEDDEPKPAKKTVSKKRVVEDDDDEEDEAPKKSSSGITKGGKTPLVSAKKAFADMFDEDDE